MNESNQAQAIKQQIECVRDEAAVLLSGLPSTKEETLARIDKMGNALMDAEDILKGKTTAEAIAKADKENEAAKREMKQGQTRATEARQIPVEPIATAPVEPAAQASHIEEAHAPVVEAPVVEEPTIQPLSK